jgi:hypothetical protein
MRGQWGERRELTHLIHRAVELISEFSEGDGGVDVGEDTVDEGRALMRAHRPCESNI